MLSVLLSQQVLGIIGGLTLAYFTGAWRRYGRRMERLYELAEKLPEGSAVRALYEAAAYREAERMVAKSLALPPLRVRVARGFLWLFLLNLCTGLLLLSLWGQEEVDETVARLGFDLGFSLGRLSAEAEARGLPFWFVFATTYAVQLLSIGALISLVVLGLYGLGGRSDRGSQRIGQTEQQRAAREDRRGPSSRLALVMLAWGLLTGRSRRRDRR